MLKCTYFYFFAVLIAVILAILPNRGICKCEQNHKKDDERLLEDVDGERTETYLIYFFQYHHNMAGVVYGLLQVLYREVAISHHVQD